MDKESKPAWNVLGLDANLGTVRCGGKLTVRLGCSESQLRVEASHRRRLFPYLRLSVVSGLFDAEGRKHQY